MTVVSAGTSRGPRVWSLQVMLWLRTTNPLPCSAVCSLPQVSTSAVGRRRTNSGLSSPMYQVVRKSQPAKLAVSMNWSAVSFVASPLPEPMP